MLSIHHVTVRTVLALSALFLGFKPSPVHVLIPYSEHHLQSFAILTPFPFRPPFSVVAFSYLNPAEFWPADDSGNAFPAES